jgi:hypothetical protein
MRSVDCHFCKTPVNVGEAATNSTIRCPYCARDFVLPPPLPPLGSPGIGITLSLVNRGFSEPVDGLLIAGYLCGVLSLLFFPIFLGIGGIVCGILTLNKGKIGHGIAIIVLSAALGSIGMGIGAAIGYRSFR